MGIFGWSLPPGCGALPGEGGDVYEQNIGGIWYAWDDSDNVFKYSPGHPEARDDGFIWIGKIQWPDDPGPEFDSRILLREFVSGFAGAAHG